MVYATGVSVSCDLNEYHRNQILKTDTLNLLAPGGFEWNLRYSIFKLILEIEGWGISCVIALRWMSLDIIGDKSTLVKVTIKNEMRFEPQVIFDEDLF